MVAEKIKIEPMIIVREVLAGDRVTLSFQKSGYIYFQPIDKEQIWTQEKQTQ